MDEDFFAGASERVEKELGEILKNPKIDKNLIWTALLAGQMKTLEVVLAQVEPESMNSDLAAQVVSLHKIFESFRLEASLIMLTEKADKAGLDISAILKQSAKEIFSEGNRN